MDKRVIIAMGLAAIMFAVILALLTRPASEPTETVSAPAPRPHVAKAPVRTAPKAATRVAQPLEVANPQPLEGGAASPKRPVGKPQYQTHAPGVPQTAAQEEARREYRCRTLQEQADLMDRLIVVGSGRTLQPDQRTKMVSRVATLGTRVFEEDENVRAGTLDCGDNATTDLTAASEFLERSRDELSDLLSDQDREEISQALRLFDGELASP